MIVRGCTTVLIIGLMATGCASFNSGSVRSLSAAEVDVLSSTRNRLAANQAQINGSLNDLADNVDFAIREQYRLESNLAKAQLLEAMKSPWTATNLEATQKEVALYHLFALEEAEQKALQARLNARRARITQLKSSYGQLLTGMSALVSAKQQLLASLDQPASTQISLVLQQVAAESAAFREALAGTDDPRLQNFVTELEQRERQLSEAASRIVELLERVEEE